MNNRCQYPHNLVGLLYQWVELGVEVVSEATDPQPKPRFLRVAGEQQQALV